MRIENTRSTAVEVIVTAKSTEANCNTSGGSAPGSSSSAMALRRLEEAA